MSAVLAGSPAGNQTQFQQLLQGIVTDFADPQPLVLEFDFLEPGRDLFDPDFIGAGATVPELYAANMKGFVDEVLGSAGSPYYHLANMAAEVATYLKRFDVIPHGPDIMKYTLAFGVAFERYMREKGERPLMWQFARMRTLRLMRGAAASCRADGAAAPVVMVRKVMRSWKEEQTHRDLGAYGTYMIFKAWSLG